jgi:hypothetical protein
VFTDMKKWSEIRCRVLVDGLGKRAACRRQGLVCIPVLLDFLLASVRDADAFSG